MAAHGTFYWNELLTTDPDAAVAFYRGLIGYEVDEMLIAEGLYRVLKKDGRPVGGIMAMPPDLPAGTPPHWESYLAIDDIDATVQRVTELGGRVLRQPWLVPDVGRIAVVSDPQGAVLCLITPVEGAG